MELADRTGRIPSPKRWGRRVLVVAFVLGLCGTASAFQIDTGNNDLVMHWDNSFRYTLGQRLKGQNKDIINSPNNDDGDRNFDVGIVTNRLDLLSEFDTVYKRRFGLRLSAAAWYDQAYRSHLDNNSPFTNNHLGGGLNSYTKRHFAGPNGELLDAFVFGQYDIGDVPVDLRVGRHTIIWGESILPYGGTNGISYGQSPIDLGKALAQPGVQLKEIFRPLNQVSVTVQPTDELTVMGQYYLQWESDKFPEDGSYLGFADMYLNGGENTLTPVGPIPNGGDIKPKQYGDWGIATRWSPDWLEGTLGLYYRDFSDKSPQYLLDVSSGSPTYRFAYASGIKLLGLSLAKNIAGISVGSELSYRWDMPLVSEQVGLRPVGVPGRPVPGQGHTAGARGETMHAVVNFLGLVPKTPVFDEASWLVEFTYGRWISVSQDMASFLGRDGYTGLDRATRDNMTGAIIFTPVWRQVFPGVDLKVPLSFASGLFGTSAVTAGGAAKNGSYSAGLSFDIFAKYTAELTYAGFYGNHKTDPAYGGTIPPPGGGSAGTGAGDAPGLLSDRDLLSLTLKASF